MLPLLAAKALIAPVLLAVAAIVEHKWGVAVGGWVLGLPLTSGPASFFLLTEHGPRFAENAARGTLLGLVGAGVFVAGYSLAAQARGWRRSLAFAGIACLSVTFALSQVHLGLDMTMLFAAVVLSLVAFVARGPKRLRRRRCACTPGHRPRAHLQDDLREHGGGGRLGRLDDAGIGGQRDARDRSRDHGGHGGLDAPGSRSGLRAPYASRLGRGHVGRRGVLRGGRAARHDHDAGDHVSRGCCRRRAGGGALRTGRSFASPSDCGRVGLGLSREPGGLRLLPADGNPSRSFQHQQRRQSHRTLVGRIDRGVDLGDVDAAHQR